MYRARASEFPNDNPMLHGGAVWVRVDPCGPLEAEACPEPIAAVEAPALEGGELPATTEVVLAMAEEPPPIEPTYDIEVEVEIGAGPTAGGGPAVLAATEPEPEPPAPLGPEAPASRPPPRDAFAALVQTLVSVAMAEGATRAAAALPELLHGGRLDADALEPAAVEALVAADLVARRDDGLLATDRLTSPARAWREVLCGDGDMAECGSATLNEFAAALLAGVLGAPARTQSLQYELRRRGVAAFGMLQLAA